MISYKRQCEILQAENLANKRIAVVGVGSVGSFTAFTLAKMGARDFYLFDKDIVEAHNIPNQFYTVADINKPKTESLAKRLQTEFPNTKIQTGGAINQWTSIDLIDTDIVITSVDSMETRKTIFDTLENVEFEGIVIDPRLGGETIRVFCVDFQDANSLEYYKQNLYEDSETVELPCGQQNIIYTAMASAMIIAYIVKRYINNEELPKEIIMDWKTLQLIRI